jgi:hypothetical protein
MRAGFVYVLFAASLLAQDPAEIVLRSIERDARNFELLKDYTYTERTQTQMYGAQGGRERSTSDTYEILRLEGRPLRRKIAHDDQPLSASDARKEQERLDREVAKRRAESPADKAKLERQRVEERKFLREIPQAFALKLDGVEQVSGKPAWAIEFEPKPGYEPRDSRARQLTKVRGKLWIDQAEYQWVKGDAQLFGTLSFGFSLVRIAPGTALHFEQIRVNDEVWLPSKVTAHADARVAYLKRLRAEIDVRYRDYKKFQADSRIVEVEEKQ